LIHPAIVFFHGKARYNLALKSHSQDSRFGKPWDCPVIKTTTLAEAKPFARKSHARAHDDVEVTCLGA
jgi:hypothetical protein